MIDSTKTPDSDWFFQVCTGRRLRNLIFFTDYLIHTVTTWFQQIGKQIFYIIFTGMLKQNVWGSGLGVLAAEFIIWAELFSVGFLQHQLYRDTSSSEIFCTERTVQKKQSFGRVVYKSQFSAVSLFSFCFFITALGFLITSCLLKFAQCSSWILFINFFHLVYEMCLS